jgi:hypothetical protein
MGPAMSDGDHRSGAYQDTKYYLIFLHSIPERPLTAEAVDQHAAHLEELDDPLVRGAYETYELRTWLMSNRRNDYHPNIQEVAHK